eukprot:1921866-Alexandrium_andersonii.AAC.1
MAAKTKGRSEVSLRQLSAEELQELRARKFDEIDQWLQREVIEPAWRSSRTDVKPMRMRWVITRKAESNALKARLVVLGFQDPDLEFLPRASPTCSRRGRNLML